MTNNNNRNLEEEAKLLRISNKLIDDSESSAGEDSI